MWGRLQTSIPSRQDCFSFSQVGLGTQPLAPGPGWSCLLSPGGRWSLVRLAGRPMTWWDPSWKPGSFCFLTGGLCF